MIKNAVLVLTKAVWAAQETRVSLQAENWGQPLGGTDFLLSNEGRNGPFLKNSVYLRIRECTRMSGICNTRSDHAKSNQQ